MPASVLEDNLSGRIRRARQELGLSQQELADRVRVSQPTIVHWEQGTHTPRHLALARLADALSVSREWLVGAGPADVRVQAGGAVRIGQSAQGEGRLAYLSRPLVHVPVYPWPMEAALMSAMLDGVVAPRDMLAWSGLIHRPVALEVADPAARQLFPAGTVVVLDCAASALDRLREGAWYLGAEGGRCVLRRWRRDPDRFEADSLRDTQFDTSLVRPLGSVIGTVRRFQD
jgi:transcriptional regulator with XRE-family HTH domain